MGDNEWKYKEKYKEKMARKLVHNYMYALACLCTVSASYLSLVTMPLTFSTGLLRPPSDNLISR